MKNFSSINRMKNKGFSLIEILLVIGIIAVLAIAAFIIFPQVQASSRANTEQSNIMTMAAGVKNLFNGRYAGLTDGIAIDGNIVPASMHDGASTITSSWGGDATLAPSGTGNTLFTITYTALPTEVCLKLVPGLVQNFESITLPAGTITRDSTAADIVGACQADPASMVLLSN